jgi:uncharacterized protein (TIGR02117 family)
LHVQFMAAPSVASDDALPITISVAAYQRVAASVLGTVKLDANGQSANVPGHHYNDYDAFYEAHRHYSAFLTCNQWTRNALDAAGVRVPMWAPFDRALFWQLRGR